MNIPLKEKLREVFKYIPPVLMMLAGLYYIIVPIMSGWLEVVSPWSYRNFVLWADGFAFLLVISGANVEYFVLVLFVFYGIFYFRKYSGFTRNQKYLWGFPIIVLPFILLLTISFGTSYFERRRASYLIGGQSLVFLAGGPEKVRGGAQELLDISTEESPPMSTWPQSIRMLNGYVQVDKESNYVLVGHGHSFNMADEFGIIIVEGNTVPENLGFYNLWEISEGIYLFSR